MIWLRTAFVRVRGYLTARRGETRINQEIALHLEMLAAEYRERGLSPEEATHAARRAFGGVAQVREEWRDRSGLPGLETFGRDLAYAFRQLFRTPSFALAAILTLALGIGANTAIYQLLYAVVFRPLPVAQPQQLVEVELMQDGKAQHFSYSLFREMAAHQNVLTNMFAVAEFPLHDATLRDGDLAKAVHGALVSGEYFRVLGIVPQAGRFFAGEDDRAGAPVAIINDRFWQARFNRSPAALGKIFDINHVVVTIIGVAPRGFFGETVGQSPDVWLPMGLEPRLMPEDYLNAPYFAWLRVIGRLRPEVPIRRAQAVLDAFYQQAPSLENSHVQLTSAVCGINDLRQFFAPLYFLMATVGLILLIASCNLANLLLSRAAARSQEIGVRLALGASRARLVRQLLTESFLLSAIGAAMALLFAQWGSRGLVSLAGQQVSLDAGFPTLAFTASVAVVVTCLFGIAPALAATRADVQTALQSSRTTTADPRRHSLARALVITQLSISLLLVSAAGLLARTVWNLRHQDFGFEPERILQVIMPFDISSWRRLAAEAGALKERIEAVPGVRSVALASCGPFAEVQATGPFATADRPAQESDGSRMTHVSPEFFGTMARIVAGRPITIDDRKGSPSVAVISETAALRLFGRQNPLGRFISGSKRFDSHEQILVVGVAHDVRYTARDPSGFVVYLPLAQSPTIITDIEILSGGDPAHLAAAVRDTIHSVDPTLRLGEIRLLRDSIEASLTQEKMLAWLSAAFGVLALLLTFVGIFGVLSYTAQRRRREIGIRLALGARPCQITRLVLKDVALLVAVSITLGGGASLAVGSALRKLLFGIGGVSQILTAAALSIAAVSLAAGYLPARRAAQLDPNETLREQ